MRVFLCGAQGTGKSTLVQRLESDLTKLDSFSKKYLKDNPSIQRVGEKEHQEFQDRIFLECLNTYVNEKDFISSRSIIDSHAYLLQEIDPYKLLEVARYYSKYLFTKDDLYIYLPVEFEISQNNNENRDLDKKYQKRIDTSLKTLFDGFKRCSPDCNFIELRGSIEERLEKLTKEIERIKNV